MITTLLVTLTFVQSASKALMPCRPVGNESFESDLPDDEVAVDQDVLETVHSGSRRQDADLALHGVRMNAIADVQVVMDVILGDGEIACAVIEARSAGWRGPARTVEKWPHRLRSQKLALVAGSA